MEMAEMDKAKATNEYEGAAGGQMAEAQTTEKAEPGVYAKLEKPSEDVYSEAFSTDKSPTTEPDKQMPRNVFLYRAVCIILSAICLVLLLVILILALKPQTGCTEKQAGCRFEKCKAYLPKILQKYHNCNLCPDGWLTFEGWCFYLSKFRLNWEESQKNCKSKGGSLVVITNNRVQNFLTEEGIVKYWIGLRQNGTNWSWGNIVPLGESFWAENTPEGDCGILNTNSPPEKNWIKASCKAATYFICQMQL